MADSTITTTTTEAGTLTETELKEGEKWYINYDAELESMKKQNEEGQHSLLMDLFRQLQNGIEMYRISVPAFTLQPISFLEKLSIYSTPTKLILKYYNSFCNTFYN